MMESSFSILNWDSVFFGYKVASVRPFNLTKEQADTIIQRLRDNQVRLAYIFVAPEDHKSNDTVSKCSASLVDEKVTFISTINKEAALFSDSFIRPYGLDKPDLKLKALTLQSGIYSRFKIDANFQNHEFENLYGEWIEKSVRKEIADEVLVYTEKGEIKGFVTIRIKNNIGTIGLIAVDQNERGKSIGKKLMNAAMQFSWMKGANAAEVATQKANEGACRFYGSIGFEVKNIVNVYHLWIS
jgi:dTDP-4-amino-4,6-dideoxy-D-galactose acyltransferase